MSRHDDLRRLVAATREQFGEVDILVNNAGVSRAMGLEETTDDIWQADIDLKLMAAVRLCQAVIPSMRERGAAAAGQDVNDYYADVAPRVPLGRVGEAEEFGDLVAFLVSGRAAFITGTAVNFDGGMGPVL